MPRTNYKSVANALVDKFKNQIVSQETLKALMGMSNEKATLNITNIRAKLLPHLKELGYTAITVRGKGLDIRMIEREEPAPDPKLKSEPEKAGPEKKESDPPKDEKTVAAADTDQKGILLPACSCGGDCSCKAYPVTLENIVQAIIESEDIQAFNRMIAPLGYELILTADFVKIGR